MWSTALIQVVFNVGLCWQYNLEYDVKLRAEEKHTKHSRDIAFLFKAMAALLIHCCIDLQVVALG